jgi:xylan 1,4-beta-xylosidase
MGGGMDANRFQKFFGVLLLSGCSPLFVASLYGATTTLTLSGTTQGNIPHFWSACVGTGTMEFCLKSAWTTAARIGAKEAGFMFVRGHGILIRSNNVDVIHVGTYPNWSFSVIDQIYDTLIACGLKPVVELDFMPTSLQSNGVTSPPNNYGNWKDLIAKLASHLESRYGAAEVRKWYWEVWNEYDYSGFWNSDAAHYYTMYDSAARGVRSVDTNILIGGPATTSSGPVQNFWNNCNGYGIKFLSDHQYGVGSNNNQALPTNIRDDNRNRSNVISGTGKKLFSLNTEYNSSYSGQGGNRVPNCISMDNHQNAPFIVKTTKLIITDCIGGKYLYPDVLSYWTISDCFDEWGSSGYMEGNNYVPFGEVFGLINYQGIRKAAFNAYAMLNKMGTSGLSLTGGSGDADGIDGFATVNATGDTVAVIVYSYYNDLTTTGADNTVNLSISSLPFSNGQKMNVSHYRIDSLHSNPYAIWEKLGKPTSPTTAQWDSMRAHQNLERFEADTSITYTGAFTKSFNIPRWGVSLLRYAKTGTGISNATWAYNRAFLSLRGTRLMVNNLLNEPVGILIYSADGRLLKNYKSTQRSLDLSKGLAKGIYCIDAEVRGLRIVDKMVVP